MLFLRREFLRSAIGAVMGMSLPKASHSCTPAMQQKLPAWREDHESILATSPFPELFGIPKSAWHVHHGLHPFSPERTLILRDFPEDDSCRSVNMELTHRIIEDLDANGTKCTVGGIRHIVQAASVLTRAYSLTHQIENWSKRLAHWLFCFYGYLVSDNVWISPIGWQGYQEQSSTTNGIIDWWMFLFPQGLAICNDWSQRIHVMLTPVFARTPSPIEQGKYFSCMATVLGIMGGTSDFSEIRDDLDEKSKRHATWSSCSPTAACLAVNEQIAEGLLNRRDQLAVILKKYEKAA